MTPYICATCCAEFPPSDQPPASCPICSDERQYVKPEGQKWTSGAEIAQNHKTELRQLEPGLLGIGVTPALGIGQRALLIEHPEGGILWEGVPLLDDAAVAEIQRRGGVRAMVMSHPHLYGAMVTNAEKLGGVPIHLPAGDRDWTMRPSELIRYFDAERLDLGGGIVQYVTGGHFEGSSILHWPQGAGGKGAIFTGDTINITPDTRWASFMWSYPNLVPLDPHAVRRIVGTTEPLAFERIYAAWWHSVLDGDAKARLAASEARYVRHMGHAVSAPGVDM